HPNPGDGIPARPTLKREKKEEPSSLRRSVKIIGNCRCCRDQRLDPGRSGIYRRNRARAPSGTRAICIAEAADKLLEAFRSPAWAECIRRSHSHSVGTESWARSTRTC